MECVNRREGDVAATSRLFLLWGPWCWCFALLGCGVGLHMFRKTINITNYYIINVSGDVLRNTLVAVAEVVAGSGSDFLHCAAFASALGLLVPVSSRWRVGVISSWCFVECVLELLQHEYFRGRVLDVTQSHELNIINGFIVNGVFDECDLVAYLCGMVVAFAVVRNCRVTVLGDM